MSREVMTVNKVDLSVKEYKGQRVVTFKDIDRVHERPEGTARKRFNDNKKHFILGTDYIVQKTDEAKKEFGIKAPNGLILLTESGYLLIVKSFTDDLAWSVQRQLVNSYFKLKEVSYDIAENVPIDLSSINKVIHELSNNFQTLCKQVNSMENAFDTQFIEFKKAMERISLLLPKTKTQESLISKVSTDPIRDTIRPLAELYNDKSVGYNNTYRKVYAAMPVNWQYRQSAYRNRKGNKNKPSKLALLESDKKLFDMFSEVVKQLMFEAMEVPSNEE